MEKRSIVLLLSLGVIISFFFPFFNWSSFELSGPNYILSMHTPSYKYILLLIPFAAVFVFLKALYGEHLTLKKSLISWLPLVSLVLIFILIGTGEGLRSVVSNAGSGFWMILAFSLMLALFPNKRKLHTTDLYR